MSSALAGLMCVVLVLTSCGDPGAGGDSTAAGDPVKGEWIVIHELSDPEGVNPLITNDASASAIFNRVFEKLLEQDFATTELYPVLAEARPTISDDHLTYTFKLREGIRFSDGKPLTAKDVIFSFKVVKNPLITDGAALRNYYESVKDVVSPDDRTIVITMSKPYFLAEYFLGTLWIVPKHIFDPKGLTDKYSFDETNSIDKASGNAALKEFATWYNTADVKRDMKLNVGSGPYMYDEWKTGESVTLKRNDNFWNAGKDKWNPSYAEKLIYKVVNDRSSAVVALKNGELDFMEYVPAAKYTEEIDTVATPFLRKYAFASQSYSYIGFNMQRPILNEVNVRKAIAHCLDRDALIKQVVRGLATKVNTAIYQERPEYDKSIPSIDYNPTEAKKLLAAGGWADSDGDGILDKVINGRKTPLHISFLINAGNEMREAIAITLSDDLKRIGVKLDIRKLEWSVFLENLRTRNFELYIGGWVNDPIPSDPYQIWHSSQIGNKGSNYVSFNNKRADELLDLNRIEFDEQKRIAYMKDFQQIVANEQPYVFLWSPLYPSVYNNRLQNVKYSAVRPGYSPTQWWVPKSGWKYAPVQ
ncbi:MAG: ABC transporter substrate-binding protein [Candidatus Kapabacteria bacterium]|nr:ABC transporter substrate-binding protein [Candidatus Kapabacteria bacterium]